MILVIGRVVFGFPLLRIGVIFARKQSPKLPNLIKKFPMQKGLNDELDLHSRKGQEPYNFFSLIYLDVKGEETF